MKIENIDIEATIEKARRLVNEDKNLSAATQSMFEIMILIAISPVLNIGGHTLLVEQKTDKGVVRDAYTFNLTVSDFPKDKEER